MADLTTLQGWLLEAETALHQLNTGKLTASASYNGKSVTYSQTDRDRLAAYISSLRQQIADLTGTSRRRGPMQIAF
jgi:hypothetical protein